MYNRYMQPDAEVKESLWLKNPQGVAEGFINCKILMTKAEGHIFLLYTMYTWL